MARIDIIIAKLPALIADRSDSLKLETAIRYVGDIIFDASQNRNGDKAKALAKVLSGPGSPEEAQSREAILTLFRDGYLDRYAEYTALKDIALAAGISSDPARMDLFNQESATADAPRVVVLTGMLNAPTASVNAAVERPERVKSVDALKLRAPIPRKDEPVRRPKTANETASDRAAGERVEPGRLQSKEPYVRRLPVAAPGAEARDRTKSATASLEISSVDSSDRSPLEFAKKFKENPADKLSEMGFPCLVGFVPKISIDERSVEWANPVTADSFRDHGLRLTSGSPSRLAIRAMLELARADNWTSVAVKGTVRLQAFTEATAAELDRLFPVSPGRGTADRSFHEIPRPSSVGPKSRRLSRVIGMSASLLVLVQMGFGVAYIYSSPQLQTRLGIKSFIDTLPWKHDELSAKARENPLEFSQMTLALSTRTGTALAPPQAQFNDTDLTNAHYLKWTATFKNLLAGLEGHDEKVEARFFDPSGVRIASSAASVFVGRSQKTADFSGVALMPSMTDMPGGTYRVALYSGDKMLTQESFQVNQNLSAKKAAPAAIVPNAETRAGNPFREPEMVVVPPGNFTMGSPSSELRRLNPYYHTNYQQHQVTIRYSFAVGKYAVTRDEYARFASETSAGSKWQNPGFAQTGRDPVVNVSWDDAEAYVRWLTRKTGKNYRLLSEAEYEYAERAGTSTVYWWGDSDVDLCKYANGAKCDHRGTAPVGSYLPNRFGLYDMAGNVWEWTEDCFNDSHSAAPDDGTGMKAGTCGMAVIRGGSWGYDSWGLRSSYRDSLFTGNRSIIGGFRVARTLGAASAEAAVEATAKEEQRKPDEEARKLAMKELPAKPRENPLNGKGVPSTGMTYAAQCKRSGFVLLEPHSWWEHSYQPCLPCTYYEDDASRIAHGCTPFKYHGNGRANGTRCQKVACSTLPPPGPETRETTNTFDTSKESVADARVPYTATPCKVCYNAQNGHYYRYVSAPAITWQEAEAQAAAAKYRGLPGYLATVTSTEEFNFINNVVFSVANFPSGIPANVYVGGTDSSAPGTWSWVTGPEEAGDSGAGLSFYSSDSVQNGLIAPWDSHDSQGQIDGSTGEYYLALNGWFEPGFSVLSGTALGTVYAGGNSGYLVEYSSYGLSRLH